MKIVMNMQARAMAVALIALCLLPYASVEAASRNSAKLLQYIPADTPYVFAATKPTPDKLADKIEPKIDQILKIYQAIARQAMADKLVEMSAEDDGGEGAEKYRGVIEEVLGLMSIDGLRSVGIERDSASAFYGNGLTPVLRIELSDSDLFDKAIERIENKAGEALLVGEAKGDSYKYVDFEAVRLIIATLDSQLVITAVPTQFDEAQTALALGIDKPRQNLRKSKKIGALNKQYGFEEFLTGYLDFVRLAEIFTGGATGLDKDIFEIVGFETPELSDVCRTETMQLVNVAPRMVIGYTELNVDHIDSKAIIEMREDIAAGMAGLTESIPGLGTDPGGLFSMGLSLNPLKAKDFYIARLDALQEDPFKCESLAGLQAGAEQGRAALNQPLPPVVYSFRGFVANVLDIKGLDLAGGQPPESVDATMLFAVENAQSLVMMGALVDPQIAALNLEPNGKPVKLELPQLALIAEQAFAALSDNALSISLGEGAETNAASVLKAAGVDPAPFISVSIDSARYYGMIGDAMMLEQENEDGEAMPLATRKLMRELMIVSGSMYERLIANVHFAKEGVVIDSRANLGD